MLADLESTDPELAMVSYSDSAVAAVPADA
jgi:hypothetical protein